MRRPPATTWVWSAPRRPTCLCAWLAQQTPCKAAWRWARSVSVVRARVRSLAAQHPTALLTPLPPCRVQIQIGGKWGTVCRAGKPNAQFDDKVRWACNTRCRAACCLQCSALVLPHTTSLHFATPTRCRLPRWCARNLGYRVECKQLRCPAAPMYGEGYPCWASVAAALSHLPLKHASDQPATHCSDAGWLGDARVPLHTRPCTGPVHIADVQCTAAETELSACRYTALPVLGSMPWCTHAYDIGVACTQPEVTTIDL